MKETVMLYFSGTGNSKYIAELFSQNINAESHSIESNVDFGALINENEVIGFCYPVYFSRVPRIMREFVGKHIKQLKNKKLLIFCTQQILSGDGARAFTDLFPKGYVQVLYAEHFFMPSNIWPITTNARKIKKYYYNAERKMQVVCRNIINGNTKKRGFNFISRILGLIQAPLALPIERKANNSVKISAQCTNCELCISICPMKNFHLENNKIEHNHNCTVCYRCVNKCPNKALTVVFHGKIKNQYRGLQGGKYAPS